MTESIGTARVDLVVDTANFEAGIAKAKRSTEGFDETSTRSSQRQEQNSKRQVASLEKQIATLGKSRDEVIRWRIEQQTSGKVAEELTRKLDAQVARLGAQTKAFAGTNKTARELQFAMRGLPAQITDITTSLASGQRPLLVLLQQGGQLKDMFGGIGPAVRALGGSLMGLVNPATLAAGAIAGLGFAWHQAESEAAAFNRALILTGNQAGLTVEQLRAMADEIDSSTTATAGKASEVLAQVAATGKFTAEQIELISQAAINLETATGRSIEKTVSEFAQLAKDPLDAILKLNEAIGDGTNVTNFLTRAQLDAIAKFKEQGNEAEATRVAIEAYAEAINGRAPEVVQNLTLISGVFRDIKTLVSETGGSVVGFFRDLEVSARDFFQSYGNQVQGFAKANARLGFIPFASTTQFVVDSFAQNSAKPDFSNVQGSPDATKTVDSAAERARMDAIKEFDRLHLSNLSKQEQLEREIARIKEVGLKAGKSQAEIDKEIANAQARYRESLPKERKKRGPSEASIQNAQDRFTDMTARIRAELEGPLQRAQDEHLRRMRELEQAAKKGKIPHDQLAAALELEAQAFQKSSDAIRFNLESQVAALSGPVAQVQADHAERLRTINELSQQLGLSGEVVNRMLEEEAQNFALATREAERAADPIGALLGDMAMELDIIGKSNAERAVMNELRRLGIDIMGEEAQAALATARAFEEEADAKIRSIELMDEFRQGAADAITDFVTGAKSAKEALTDFFDSLAQKITQMIAERWIDQLFGRPGTDGSGTSGGGWLGALANIIFGGGSTASGSTGSASMLGWMANGYNVGGYTGPGSVNDPAGVVHAGEIVWSQADIARHGGVGRVEAMRRGSPMGNSQVTHIHVAGAATKATIEQISRADGRRARRSMSRTG